MFRVDVDLPSRAETDTFVLWTDGVDAGRLAGLMAESGRTPHEAAPGNFSAVVASKRDGTLTLHSDDFGARPLFYRRHKDGVAVSDDPRRLAEGGIDDEAAMTAMMMHYIPYGRTLWKGVWALQPGAVAVFDPYSPDGFTDGWDSCRRRREPRTDADGGAAPGDTLPLLRRAVRSLARPVKTACQLSGGLDSSLVAALASREVDLTAYTVAFPDKGGMEEVKRARETASMLGIPLVEVEGGADAVLDAMERAVTVSGNPCVNGHMAARLLMDEAMMRDGVKLVFAGEGADEAFLGYPHLFGECDPYLYGTEAPDGIPMPYPAMTTTIPFLQAKLASGRKLMERLADGLRPPKPPPIEFVPQHAPAPLANLQVWMMSALPRYILGALGRPLDKACGLEAAMPFLDRAVFGHAMRLPLPADSSKAVLREAARGLVPESVRAARKRSFQAPPLTLGLSPEGMGRLAAWADANPLLRRGSLPFKELSESGDVKFHLAWEPAVMLAASIGILYKNSR